MEDTSNPSAAPTRRVLPPALVVRSVCDPRFVAGHMYFGPRHLHSIQVSAGRRVDSEIGPQDVLRQRERNLLIENMSRFCESSD